MGNEVLALILAPLVGAAMALTGKLFEGKTGGGRDRSPKRRPFSVSRLLSYAALLPFAASVVALADSFRRVTGGAVLRYHMGGWPPPYGIGLYLDGLGWIVSALVVVLTVVVALAALSDRRYGARFYFFLMMLAVGMQGVALAGDLFNMFVSFEIIAVAAYVLIAYDREPAALLASFKYLILSSVGILFFLFGVLLVYRDTGTLGLNELSGILARRPDLAATHPMHLALAALCVGIGVRTAFIPFHTWLPEAHAYAPHPVSAILSGVLIKVSFFGIIRILWVFHAQYLNNLFLWIGAVTALLAVIRALAQSDAKKLLAYHSISQMGYVLAAFGAVGAFGAGAAVGTAGTFGATGAFGAVGAAAQVGAGAGEVATVTGSAATAAMPVIAAVSHAVNHALFKSLLFLTIGYAVARTGERNLYNMPRLGRATPLVALAFLVGALSIAGLPPFNGYVSKQLISSAMNQSPAYYLVWLAGVGTVASFIKLSRIFSFRIAGDGVGSENRGAPSVDRTGDKPGEGPWKPAGRARRASERPPKPGALFTAAVVLLATLCLVFGLFGDALVPLYGRLLNGADSGAVDYVPDMFSPSKLMNTMLIVALGIGVFFLARTHRAKSLWKQINRLTPDLHAVLVLFFVGLILFAVVAY